MAILKSSRDGTRVLGLVTTRCGDDSLFGARRTGDTDSKVSINQNDQASKRCSAADICSGDNFPIGLLWSRIRVPATNTGSTAFLDFSRYLSNPATADPTVRFTRKQDMPSSCGVHCWRSLVSAKTYPAKLYINPHRLTSWQLSFTFIHFSNSGTYPPKLHAVYESIVSPFQPVNLRAINATFIQRDYQQHGDGQR